MFFLGALFLYAQTLFQFHNPAMPKKTDTEKQLGLELPLGDSKWPLAIPTDRDYEPMLVNYLHQRKEYLRG